jgi:hypothetical protein
MHPGAINQFKKMCTWSFYQTHTERKTQPRDQRMGALSIWKDLAISSHLTQNWML